MLFINCNKTDCLKKEVMKYYNIEYKNNKKNIDDCLTKEFNEVNCFGTQIK